jgi:hypothetical protein
VTPRILGDFHVRIPAHPTLRATVSSRAMSSAFAWKLA